VAVTNKAQYVRDVRRRSSALGPKIMGEHGPRRQFKSPQTLLSA